jgi:hypothetical protein
MMATVSSRRNAVIRVSYVRNAALVPPWRAGPRNPIHGVTTYGTHRQTVFTTWVIPYITVAFMVSWSWSTWIWTAYGVCPARVITIIAVQLRAQCRQYLVSYFLKPAPFEQNPPEPKCSGLPRPRASSNMAHVVDLCFIFGNRRLPTRDTHGPSPVLFYPLTN